MKAENIYSLQEIDYILSNLRRPFHGLDLTQVNSKAAQTCISLEIEMTIPTDPAANLISDKATIARAVRVLERAKQMFHARSQARQILRLIQEAEILFFHRDSALAQLLMHPEKTEKTQIEKKVLSHSANLLKKLQSLIAIFKEDTKLYNRVFLFNGKDALKYLCDLELTLDQKSSEYLIYFEHMSKISADWPSPNPFDLDLISQLYAKDSRVT